MPLRDDAVADAKTWLVTRRRRLLASAGAAALFAVVLGAVAFAHPSSLAIAAVVVAIAGAAAAFVVASGRLRRLERIQRIVEQSAQHAGVVVRSNAGAQGVGRGRRATLRVEVVTRQGPCVATTFRSPIGAPTPSFRTGAGVRLWTGRHECVIASCNGLFIGEA